MQLCSGLKDTSYATLLFFEATSACYFAGERSFGRLCLVFTMHNKNTNLFRGLLLI